VNSDYKFAETQTISSVTVIGGSQYTSKSNLSLDIKTGKLISLIKANTFL